MLVAYFVALPLAAWMAGRLHQPDKGGEAPWKYVYSVLVYLACVPGTLAGVLTAYALFIARQNLLDVDALVYLAPIVSMGFSLGLMRRSVNFDRVPGFDRISGLIALLSATFVLVLLIQKTQIWVVIGASPAMALGFVALLFAALKQGADAVSSPQERGK